MASRTRLLRKKNYFTHDRSRRCAIYLVNDPPACKPSSKPAPALEGVKPLMRKRRTPLRGTMCCCEWLITKVWLGLYKLTVGWALPSLWRTRYTISSAPITGITTHCGLIAEWRAGGRKVLPKALLLRLRSNFFPSRWQQVFWDAAFTAIALHNYQLLCL